MARPSNAAIRAAIDACRWTMGTTRERAALVGRQAMLDDARTWHRLSREGGLLTASPAQCAAWAVLYRAAFAGRL